MKDIPIPNWIPLALVIAFAVVVWRAPLPNGQLGWHIAAALGVLVLCRAGGVGPGAVKLLAAMALWLGMEDALAWFAMLVGFGGPLALFVYKRCNVSGANSFPIAPFAAPAFALTLMHAPIWKNIVAATTTKPAIESQGFGAKQPMVEAKAIDEVAQTALAMPWMPDSVAARP